MLIRELLPELTDEKFSKLVLDISKKPLLDFMDISFKASESTSGIQLSDSDTLLLGPTAEPVMFYALFNLLIENELSQIYRIVRRFNYVDANHLDNLAKQLVGELAGRLLNFYMRPLVAHIKKVSAQGLLQGDTPEIRYEDYCRRWYKDFQDDFYTSYSLLRYVHTTIVDQFCIAVSEIFERVQARESDIRKLLDIKDAESLKLESLALAGDHHNGGRTGCMLVFQQGTVVYKPRSIEGEQAYYNIIQKLAAHGAPAMRAARVVVGDGYGFMEFVEREENVDFWTHNFLEKTGILAALLYALQGKDMHMENIIPLKEGPVPIDLETTLHPMRVLLGNNLDVPEDSAFIYALRGISTSALLPTRLTRGGSSQDYLDVGFIQGEQGNNPFNGMDIERPFRDDSVVRFKQSSEVSKSDKIKTQNNIKDVDEVTIQAIRANSFSQGFVKMYRWICENRDTVLNLVSNEYNGIMLRSVLKPTMYYGQLIRMLGSPEALSSRDVFTTIALRTATFDQDSPTELIVEEAKALWQFDIPFFVHRTDSHRITSSSGFDVGIPIKTSSLEETLEHIVNMGEEDLDNQLNQVWSAFVSPYPNDTLANKSTAELWQGRDKGKEEKILSAKIANQLLQRIHPGITDNDSWTWAAPTPGTQKRTNIWDTTVLGLDLYTGSTGAALVLAQAAYILEDEEYTQAAHRVFDPIAKNIVSYNRTLDIPDDARDSAFFGEPGIAFALAGAAEYMKDSRLKDAAAVLGDRVAERLARAEHPSPDYLTGQVGAAALLLGYDLADDREALLGVLDRHAQDIIDGQVEEEWWSHSGFAHGISASIFALSRWNQQMPSPERARHAVKILLEHLREFDNGESWEKQISYKGDCSTLWCHGSAGISLALAAVHVWIPEISNRSNLDRAVHDAFYRGTGYNLTYCHGDMGTLDILEWVVNHVPDLSDAEKIRDILANGYSTSLLQETLEDKSVRYSLTPSYMVGTSGVLSWLTRRIGGTRLYTPIIPDSTEA